MSLEIIQIPALTDNYIYLIHDKKTALTAVVDPAEDGVVNEELKKQNWKLDFIFNTHHHYDHVDGNLGLKNKWNCKIYAHQKDAHRILGVDKKLEAQEEFYFGSTLFQVIEVPGHTIGHIMFWAPQDLTLFCGDTLFSMGCGYLFEGSYQQMFVSLSKIKNMPKETKIYCGHEYTLKNAEFALTVDAKNPDLQKRYQKTKDLRQKNQATVPFLLKEELETNPFLRATNRAEFQQIRELKNNFK